MIRPRYIPNENGCWIWQLGTSNGYGWYGRQYAHRVMYETHIGGLTKSTELHHRCHNRLCVNPYHLVPSTPQEHRKHHQQEQEFCAYGHSRKKENIYVTKDSHWQCKTCKNNRQKNYQARDGAARHQARLDIVNGVRRDYGKMPVKELAKKYGISWRSIYRYIKADPKKLGYF